MKSSSDEMKGMFHCVPWKRLCVLHRVKDQLAASLRSEVLIEASAVIQGLKASLEMAFRAGKTKLEERQSLFPGPGLLWEMSLRRAEGTKVGFPGMWPAALKSNGNAA